MTTPFTPPRRITFGYQRGSSQSCSRSIRIQYMPQCRQQEREERESFEAMQYQYEMATWKMQDRILRYRENKLSPDGSAATTEATTSETIIAYYDDDDDDNDSCLQDLQQEEANYAANEHFEIFQMDL